MTMYSRDSNNDFVIWNKLHECGLQGPHMCRETPVCGKRTLCNWQHEFHLMENSAMPWATRLFRVWIFLWFFAVATWVMFQTAPFQVTDNTAVLTIFIRPEKYLSWKFLNFGQNCEYLEWKHNKTSRYLRKIKPQVSLVHLPFDQTSFFAGTFRRDWWNQRIIRSHFSVQRQWIPKINTQEAYDEGNYWTIYVKVRDSHIAFSRRLYYAMFTLTNAAIFWRLKFTGFTCEVKGTA